ncbi:MAG: ABC transporter substrate-binding protein [candidate division NC10 bacterium]|nr:ABC transporter substrate-binding protein [candidate division NC10 bacterium]
MKGDEVSEPIQNASETGLLKAAFEPAGSPRWLMYVLKKLGLDRKHGILLEIILLKDQVKGSLQSFELALQDGTADLVDIDWISIARHRTRGTPITAVFPYGRIVGGLITPQGSPIRDLKDLRGRRIGVVRLLDKNWLIARGACLKLYGFDPQQEGTVIEALSKTALVQLLEQGKVDAAFQFWQLIPPLIATGQYRQVLDVQDLIRELGVKGMIPITAFTVKDEFLSKHPSLVQGFIHAFREAATFMKEEDRIWEEIGREVLGGVEAGVLHALRDSWRSRVMTSWTDETIQEIHCFFDELVKLVGAEALGLTKIPPGTFTTAFAV